jgi:hypothetical protein
LEYLYLPVNNGDDYHEYKDCCPNSAWQMYLSSKEIYGNGDTYADKEGNDESHQSAYERGPVLRGKHYGSVSHKRNEIQIVFHLHISS